MTDRRRHLLPVRRCEAREVTDARRTADDERRSASSGVHDADRGVPDRIRGLHDPGPCVTKGGIRRLGWSGASSGRAHNERGAFARESPVRRLDLEECDKRRRSAASRVRPKWAITWGNQRLAVTDRDRYSFS
jgi:hypothetical protein